MKHSQRIAILDGFRAIAILAVILFHFYACFTAPRLPVNYYPYGNIWEAYFRYGYFGVQLFFVISGFVIFYTLEKSLHLRDFAIKRFTRLFPAMLLFSVTSYFFVEIADSQNYFGPLHAKTPLDFFPSITFTPPILWAKIFNSDKVYYIDRSYWSLWAEVCFYAFSSLLYFFNKQKFVRNWMFLLIPFTIIRLIGTGMVTLTFESSFLNTIITIIKKIDTYCKFCDYAIYFSLGIFFYCLFFKKAMGLVPSVMCVLFGLLEFYLLENNSLRILYACILALFILLVYKPRWLAFLQNKVVMRIGVISYGLYLLNENVGLVLINKLCGFVSSQFMKQLVPIAVLLIMIVFCEISYRFFETPVSTWLRKRLLKRGRNTGKELKAG